MWSGLLLLVSQQPLELLPLDSLALAGWDRPDEGVRAIQQGELWRRVQASGLWDELQEQPGYPIAALAWGGISAPVGGDPARFARALAGGGLAAALLPREGSSPGLLVVARMGDPEAAQDCLTQLAALARIPARGMHGESWRLPAGELTFAREGEWLMAASDVAWIDAALARLSAASAAPAPAFPEGVAQLRARAAAAAAGAPAGLWIWARGELLRAGGYAPLPQDLGASLLGADLHEALRVAGWFGATLHLDGAGLRAEFLAPEPAELGDTHAPFRPGAPAVELPKLGGALMRGVIVRDFGAWYNARDRYASAAAVAGSIEGDGNLRLLFGRDFGPEVLAWLEPQARLIVAVNPDAAARALELELPAAAIGLRLRRDAPDGLRQGFANAFLAAVTFANLQSGSADEKQLLMDLEKTDDGSLAYLARRPALAAGAAAPLAHNAEPALWIGDDGDVWISSSIGLLREILAAPVETVRAEASWAEIDLDPLGALVTRARGAIVARRLLQNGGDFDAAGRFADLVEAATGLLDRAALRIGPVDGWCGVQFEVRADAE